MRHFWSGVPESSGSNDMLPWRENVEVWGLPVSGGRRCCPGASRLLVFWALDGAVELVPWEVRALRAVSPGITFFV